MTLRTAGSASGARACLGLRNQLDMADLSHLHGEEELAAAFRKYLKNRGIKDTAARRRILDAVLEMQGHFEAEQVLYLLREKSLTASKATVYRTLPLLVDCGILKQVRFEVKQAYYEHAFGEAPHDHMVCRRCGRIIEFDADEVVELCRRIGRRNHFHVITHRFHLSGLCWDCSIKCPVATMPLGDETAGGGGSSRGM